MFAFAECCCGHCPCGQAIILIYAATCAVGIFGIGVIVGSALGKRN